MNRTSVFCVLPLLALISLVGTLMCAEPGRSQKETNWRNLFDGKTLKGWKVTNFGGEGQVTVEKDTILMEFGSSLTGITYQGQPPTVDYELSLEAQKVDGNDFFCGLTFPVGKSHCTLIVGGWGGAVVGISSIDGRDASENATTSYMSFDKNRWYRIRVRVQADRIQAWIDDKEVVNQDIRGRRISTRAEVELSAPLGIAAFETRAALRNIRMREVKEPSK